MRDYISREDAIMVAGDMLNSLTGISCKDGENTAREYFRSIPSTDIRENVRGEWIEKYYESNETGETVFHGMIMCSVCGHVPKVGWLSNFCPNCGADMRGENDG